MNRRQFLQASLASAGVLATSSGLAKQLMLSQALSASRFSDYKALVCIFLYGGHDSFNLLVPTDLGQYNDYARTRQSLAYARDDLVSFDQSDAMPLGAHFQAQPIVDLFNNKRLSVAANLGPMVAPTSKNELLNNNSLLPPQLFSHNDQQLLWQNGTVDVNVVSGWGGRMADLLLDSSSSLPLSFSLGGTNIFQTGRQSQHYVMNTDGPENFGGLESRYEWDHLRIQHYMRILDDAQGTFDKVYADKIRSVRQNNETLITALESIPPSNSGYAQGNYLGEQLAMIARLIQAQSQLGQSRQIFFAAMGEFDTHDNQANLLPQLQGTLAQALSDFDRDLQDRGLSNQVVTFTQSEFGRTLTSNGDGTDHGWAGHQLIMGDPVSGGRIFGDVPEQVINTQDDLGDGRIIPTTSIEQFGSQLSRWFGLSDTEVNDIFPNLYRFDSADWGLFG